MTQHNPQDLIQLFNDLFEQSENTILVGDAEEPLYLPPDEHSEVCRVIFTRDYFASALHEIAHWCLAGDKRRQQIDYGYWYFPEGRTPEQQRLFEQAEVKPQALECIFSQSAGLVFRASKDDFSAGCDEAGAAFELNIAAQVQQYLIHGLPERATQFNQRLLAFYRQT